MKFLIINGSPKGNYSVTLHTSLYLKEVFKEHEFDVINVGQKIKYYEKHMDEAIKEINKADVLIFSYPVYIKTHYTFLFRLQNHFHAH